MFPIQFFFRAAERYPDRVAVKSSEETITYRQLVHRVAASAAGIHAADPTYQARIAVGGANSVHHLVAILATLAAGNIWVPLNPRNGTPELLRMVEFTSPSLLLVDRDLALRLKDCGQKMVSLERGLEGWSRQFMDERVPVPTGALSDVQAIKFTGGTTGVPKGVMQTYRAWSTTIVTQWREFGFDENDRFLISAPLTHGASTYLLPILGAGGMLVFPDELKPAAILEAVQKHGITTVFMPPTLIYAVVHEMELNPRDTQSLKRLIYGAAPMPSQKVREVQRVLGNVLATTYGQTEAPQIIACLGSQELADPRNIASVGRPTLMTDVRIMGKEGEMLPPGEEGEVVVRGDLVMAGYWRMPEETASTIRDGWLHTGDIGLFDERGFLFLKDRARDVIISGGFNVYPSDVEAVLGRHPAIFDCAVFGVEDEKWGEAVHAAVTLRPGMHVEKDDLIELVKAELGSVKAPKEVHVLEALPRSSVEKTLKSELRKSVLNARSTASS
ncbi:class I adenylate-forming enzyme family protein [Variovorax sp. EL159]|uniref:class I adenylate-forming enzyme family protein n=1 Tax=Variovorax sp. EL159 TaxID=1566270 RepID=UPI00088499C8|nr:AMP-binding protein [Variovorax sp. EL159]SCX72523.1 Acyl-CoA synthetase (AMP-forming)/AMP-acid ligase II [Variovorax sp. EL159]